jgi:molecular chaperone GrpE
MSNPKEGGQNGKKGNAAAEAEEGTESGKELELGQQKQNLKEQLLSLAAEFDNYKKRTRKDIENAKWSGAAELTRDLLPILDEFYIATMAAEKSEDKALKRGIEMLYSNLLETLKRKGLKEVECTGTYNPYIHEIMMTRDEEGAKPGTIVEVVKKGYMLGETLLRPASVIVAAEKEQKDVEAAAAVEDKKDDA